MDMKVAAIFAVLIAAVSSKPIYDCPVDEIVLNVPDDFDCAVFYKCDHGVPVNFNCPNGLIFNPDAQTCDWPSNVKHPGCLHGDQDSTTASSSSSTGTNRVTTSSPSSNTAIRMSNTSDSQRSSVSHKTVSLNSSMTERSSTPVHSSINTTTAYSAASTTFSPDTRSTGFYLPQRMSRVRRP